MERDDEAFRRAQLRVELVPHGVEAAAREIASATIGNLGGDPLHADYRYRLWSPPSHYAPGFSRDGVVSAHDRWQTPWALVRAVLEDWWTTDGWNGGYPGEEGKPRLRALLESDGTILEISHGPSAFAGTARRWSSSEPSFPLRLIRDRACANPGILLDEIEKAAAGKDGSGGRLWDGLVGMLEPETARVWLDPYVDTEVDLSAVNWVATANDLRPVPDVLLDRFRILRMPEPSSPHLPALAAAMLAELCRERGQREAWAGPLDGIELQALRHAWRGGSLRALRRLCEGVLAAREQALPRV